MNHRIVKLGGSLLKRSRLIDELICWIDQQTDAFNYWVIGGGAGVDSIRQTQREREISDTDAHWLAIEVMERNSIVLQNQLLQRGHNWPLVCDVQNASESMPNQIITPLFSMQHSALPKRWDVTSDSIAASFAQTACRLDANAELALLKSVDAKGNDAKTWSTAGLVDTYFPIASIGLPNVRCERLPSANRR